MVEYYGITSKKRKRSLFTIHYMTETCEISIVIVGVCHVYAEYRERLFYEDHGVS